MNQTTSLQRRTEQAAATDRTVLGFWIYLMTDCVSFASLFATYAVLRSNTNGGSSGRELFDIPYVLLETMVLLTSSFSCGLAVIGMQLKRRDIVQISLLATALLGILFVGLEVHEFSGLVMAGEGPTRSAFSSAYFVLVGTHGLHICIGLLWLLLLVGQFARTGISGNAAKRLTLFSMFWHFLDLIWIFIFSVVYLWGVTP